MSRAELAERLDVKRMTIWRIENGTSPVVPKRIQRFAEVLKIPVRTMRRWAAGLPDH